MDQKFTFDTSTGLDAHSVLRGLGNGTSPDSHSAPCHGRGVFQPNRVALGDIGNVLFKFSPLPEDPTTTAVLNNTGTSPYADFSEDSAQFSLPCIPAHPLPQAQILSESVSPSPPRTGLTVSGPQSTIELPKAVPDGSQFERGEEAKALIKAIHELNPYSAEHGSKGLTWSRILHRLQNNGFWKEATADSLKYHAEKIMAFFDDQEGCGIPPPPLRKISNSMMNEIRTEATAVINEQRTPAMIGWRLEMPFSELLASFGELKGGATSTTTGTRKRSWDHASSDGDVDTTGHSSRTSEPDSPHFQPRKRVRRNQAAQHPVSDESVLAKEVRGLREQLAEIVPVLKEVAEALKGLE